MVGLGPGGIYRWIGGVGIRWEREGGVDNDTQVADLGGWEDGAAVNVEEEISNLKLSLVTVKIERIWRHPDVYVMQAID